MRRKDREVTELAQIEEILEKGKVVHLGMIDGDFPYIVPLNYGYQWQNEQLILYMHGAKAGRKFDVIAHNPNVFIEITVDVEAIDGGDNPCKYSTAFGSLMGEGQAYIVTDSQEKIRAMECLMKTQTNRDFEFDEKMVGRVQVIKVIIQNYSAKRHEK